uniref:rRNA methyltransferase n=1 Tax=Thermosporothrix sp. COM3 TaxID=2490863 RepID=A0A455SR22_9CHLR|nr:rRNA methyltransferase [Thermosporothrix sp. COM3]
MTFLSSPSNPRITRLQSLHTTRGRKKTGLFLMEGPHLLAALLDAQLLPQEVYYHPALLERTPEGRDLLQRILRLLPQQRLFEVSERVIEAIGETQTSQGVVCVLAMADFAPEPVRERRAGGKRPALLILDNLADPGNMGTILRTALAADVETVLLTPECVDYFNPKVVRAAAGAHLLLPVQHNMSWDAITEAVQQHCGGRVLLAEAGSAQMYYDLDLAQPFALVIGNEAHGPSAEARQRATESISIPLASGVESLNAAMATGIILYEAVRQRRQGRAFPI